MGECQSMPQSPVPVFETADGISSETAVVVILRTAQTGFGPRAAALDADVSGILSRACSDPATEDPDRDVDRPVEVGVRLKNMCGGRDGLSC